MIRPIQWLLRNIHYSYAGLKFTIYPVLMQYTLIEVTREYHFDDIRKSDIVLDIGANIGAFSLLASKKAKHVYAVEPLYADILRENIRINNINNITVMELGLGDGTKQKVAFGLRQKTIETIPLTKILQITGPCDFLKIDCEGCEWNINNSMELNGIRRIEAEIHNFDGKHPHYLFKSLLEDAGFEYKTKIVKRCCHIVHAKRKLRVSS